MSEPLKLVEGGFGKKTFNRIIKWANRNRILTDRPGWDQTDDGILPPPSPEEGSGEGAVYWGLKVEDEALGTFTIINQGILKENGAVDGTGDVTVVNTASTFTAAVGEYIAIELTKGVGNAVVAELKTVSEWTSYPYHWDLVLDGSNYEMDSATFPIFAFIAPDTLRTDLLRVNDTISAKRMFPSKIQCFQMHEIYWENELGRAAACINLFAGFGTDE